MQFKIQKPITSSDGSDTCLIYNQARDIQLMLPFNRVDIWFHKGEVKAYVEGTVENDELTITKKIAQQSW
jgi:hypothetical protein